MLSFVLPAQFQGAGDAFKAIFKVGPGTSVNLLSTNRIDRAKKMMNPFVLRRKKAQVLKDLPNKFERIEWCDMTPLQRQCHDEAMERSKKVLLDANTSLDPLDLGTDLVEADAAPKGKAKVKTSNSGKQANESSGSNVLMDLRKASNHPMLFRRLYDDRKLRRMARDCLKEDDFEDRDKELIFEDMQVMTDFELHRFCLPYKVSLFHFLF